jgi:hypothetical protein
MLQEFFLFLKESRPLAARNPFDASSNKYHLPTSVLGSLSVMTKGAFAPEKG